jgi:predicted AAA+ superfamily ATPase
MSVLEATFVVFLLQPHFKNFNKRIIKSPKVYFHDTGLLCYLLRIRDRDQLLCHPLYGSIFENWVISERLKKLLHHGEASNLYFWRDQKGHEIDLIADEGTILHPTEIKSSMTFHPDFLKNLRYYNQLQSANSSKAPPAGECVYAGNESYSYQKTKITGWNAV